MKKIASLVLTLLLFAALPGGLAVSAEGSVLDDNTLTVNINRLRQTLARIGVHDYLVTHRGQGYSV